MLIVAVFNSRQQCHIHEQKIHSSLLPGQFPCDICDQVKNSVSLLTQHKRIVHKMKADGTRVKMKTMSMVKGPWKNIVLKDDKWTCILCNKSNLDLMYIFVLIFKCRKFLKFLKYLFFIRVHYQNELLWPRDG